MLIAEIKYNNIVFIYGGKVFWNLENILMNFVSTMDMLEILVMIKKQKNIILF